MKTDYEQGDTLTLAADDGSRRAVILGEFGIWYSVPGYHRIAPLDVQERAGWRIVPASTTGNEQP